jgi:hypothetical protein
MTSVYISHNLGVIHHMAGASTKFPSKAAVFPPVSDWHCNCKLYKMNTPQEKVQYSILYDTVKSVMIMQIQYWAKFIKEPLSRNSIKEW